MVCVSRAETGAAAAPRDHLSVLDVTMSCGSSNRLTDGLEGVGEFVIVKKGARGG